MCLAVLRVRCVAAGTSGGRWKGQIARRQAVRLRPGLGRKPPARPCRIFRRRRAEETALLAIDARRQVRGILRRRKDQVAARLGGVAAALRDARPALGAGGGEGLGEGVHDATPSAPRNRVERASDYVRGHEIGELCSGISRISPASARPSSWAAASSPGYLAARFLKSSGKSAPARCGEVLPAAGIDLDGTAAGRADHGRMRRGGRDAI